MIGVEIVFKITNGIENLVGLREIEIEIVWWENIGMIVNNNSLIKDENLDVYYIKIIKYGNYYKIPVKIVRKNEQYAIIENYSSSEIKELNLERKFQVKLYDQILIKK